MDAREFFVSTRTCCRRTPPDRREPAAPSPARSFGCPFSWLLLFGQAKRSDSAAAEADETLRQHSQRRGKPSAKIKMDSSFTRAARSAFGPASQFAPCGRSRWNDDAGYGRWD